MILFDLLFEKTAGWKKKLIETRLKSGKPIPKLDEFYDIDEKLKKLDFNKIPFYKGMNRVLDKVYGKTETPNVRLREVSRNQDKKTFSFSKIPYLIKKKLYPNKIQKRDYIDNRIKQLNAIKKKQNYMQHYLEGTDYGDYVLDSFLNSKGISHEEYFKKIPSFKDVFKKNPQLRKEFFPLSQLHKRISKDYGKKVSPKDLLYRSGKLDLPTDEIFVSGYPQVAALYPGNQFSVALRKDFPGARFTPHLATSAASLGNGNIDYGQKLRVASAYIGKLSKNRPVKSFVSPNLKYQPFHHSGRENWRGMLTPEYEATVSPSSFLNASSRRSYASLPFERRDYDTLHDIGILNNTLLSSEANYNKFSDLYKREFTNSPLNKMYLSQFRKMPTKNFDQFLPTAFLPRMFEGG